VPTTPSGLFAQSIKTDDLVSGLAQEKNIARDTKFLAQSSFAVGYAGALATVPDLSEKQIISPVTYWPFPQLEQLARVTFVLTHNAIYAKEGNYLSLLWSGESTFNRWSVADFLNFVLFSNGKEVLEYHRDTNSIIPSLKYNINNDTGCPAFKACINYNGQLLLGGIYGTV